VSALISLILPVLVQDGSFGVKSLITNVRSFDARFRRFMMSPTGASSAPSRFRTTHCGERTMMKMTGWAVGLSTIS
jgi:hypothetical protein